MLTWDEALPCTSDPDAWFGFDSDAGRRTAEQERRIERAKMLCVRDCPAAQQRACARGALERGERYGIWAGVELTLQKALVGARNEKLTTGREQLKLIAYGSEAVAS
jgi:hypothetical protein